MSDIQEIKVSNINFVNIMRSVSIFCISLLLVACATPQIKAPKVSSVAATNEAKKQHEMAAEALLSATNRLHRISHSILENGAVLCKDKVRPSIGANLWNGYYYFTEEWREALKSKYTMKDLLQFSYVVPGSPAHVAGLKSKDILISINDWNAPTGEYAVTEYLKYLSETLKDGEKISMSVQRGQEQISVDIIPKSICAYDVILDNNDIKNAYADGERIVVYRGLMDFFKTDEEAALVIAHELAHNTLEHIDAQKQNAIVGGLAGFLVDLAAGFAGINTQGQFTDIGTKSGKLAYSVEFEQEADYVGLYFMALAGYEIDGVANFWRRMAIQNPNSIQMKTSHPTTPERFVAIEQTVDEIKNKKKAGLPLEPNYNESK